MAGMDFSMDISPEMRVWISPSLIEANYILSLSRMELQDVIQQELEVNPALEMDEKHVCTSCGGILEGNFCPNCMMSQEEKPQEDSWEDYPEQMYTLSAPRSREDSDEFDPMTLVANGMSVQEQILSDVATLSHNGDHFLAEYLINSMDEHGFITQSAEEIAAETNRDADEITKVIKNIQSVAPVGAGARDLQECLLIQLRYLSDMGLEVPGHVEPIVRDYLKEFGAHKFGYIAKELGITHDDVEGAREFIREHLNPFPMQNDQARTWKTPQESPFVAPDVIVNIKDGELHVDVVETRDYHLKMNSMYDQIARQLGRSRTKGDFNDGEREHVRDHVNRAKLFISNIQQRRDTLYRISRCIVDLQEDFLRGGVRELRPLTRAIVAQQVGVHESTVSRATANKYVMLPTRKVIAFSDFFTPSLSVKDIIREMIENETEPLTDRKICDLLAKQGIRIARRTVAKYRAELNVLPSTMR
jgi:RNA polymerase sigma-54 factor